MAVVGDPGQAQPLGLHLGADVPPGDLYGRDHRLEVAAEIIEEGPPFLAGKLACARRHGGVRRPMHTEHKPMATTIREPTGGGARSAAAIGRSYQAMWLNIISASCLQEETVS